MTRASSQDRLGAVLRVANRAPGNEDDWRPGLAVACPSPRSHLRLSPCRVWRPKQTRRSIASGGARKGILRRRRHYFVSVRMEPLGEHADALDPRVKVSPATQ